MSVMKAPPKKRKRKAPKVVDRTQRAKRTKKPPKFPGLTPDKIPEFSIKHQNAFDGMQENCFNHLHKPSKIRIRGFQDTGLYYICQDCLEAYIKKNKKLKKIVIRFGH